MKVLARLNIEAELHHRPECLALAIILLGLEDKLEDGLARLLAAFLDEFILILGVSFFRELRCGNRIRIRTKVAYD
jgi:hypothetical protein